MSSDVTLQNKSCIANLPLTLLNLNHNDIAKTASSEGAEPLPGPYTFSHQLHVALHAKILLISRVNNLVLI